MHLPKTRDVPEFCREVSAFLDLLFVVTNVLPSGRNPHQTKSQSVGAILIDQLERIGRITQRLRHFPAERVANNTDKENVAERNVVLDNLKFPRLKLQSCNDHHR